MSDFLPTTDFDAPFAEGQAVDAPVVVPTDGERLMQFQRYRDETAFAQVVETHANMVWSVCSQILRHQQDVEDAFQATFLILARKARSIRATESAAGWLYRVAYRTALLAHSRHRRRNEAPLLADIPSLDDQLTDIERNEQALRLLDELNALPARYQQPLVLCYMEGRTRSEAAEQLGVSTQTIKGLLARGTRLLRSRLIRRGVALSAALGIVQSTASTAPAATPGLVSSTAALGMGFAVKSKIASMVIKGAPLKGVAACSLAEKGILAMTIAAASKPAVGVLGVCLAVGMLAVAEADPPKGTPGGDGNVVIISTSVDGESGAKLEEKVVNDSAVALASEVQTLTANLVSVVTDAAAATTSPEPGAGAQPSPSPSPVPMPKPVEALDAVGNVATVTVTNEVPVEMSVPVQSWQTVEDGAPQVQAFAYGRTAQFTPPPADVLVPRFETSASPMASGSAATLKLEGEYWALKAEGLKKKAQAIQAKVERVTRLAQQGVAEHNEGEVLDLSAEKDLTLAEVKLCEMNAQRVKESLEAKAAADDDKAKKNVHFKVEQVHELAKVAELQALKAQHNAMKAATEAQVAATIKAKEVARVELDRVERKVREARPAKMAAPRVEVRPGVIHFKTIPDSPDMVLTAPPAPAPPQFKTAPIAPPVPVEPGPEFSVVRKDELKKLLAAEEELKKLQQRLESLEAVEEERYEPKQEELIEERVKEKE
ncbi:sigma-70 family RNA polymerase sigma factor [Lacipirellula sp.]|uniref:RNA polymerase sigma factor n=1 Tax=Lacipirellula sp. TaxID=2691419 RepID=UPI003D0A241A